MRPLIFDAKCGDILRSRGSLSINSSMNGNETDADVSIAASKLGIKSVGDIHKTLPITNFAPGNFIERESSRGGYRSTWIKIRIVNGLTS